MFKAREITIMIAVAIVLAFVVSLLRSTELFLTTLLTLLIVILINGAAKKVSAFFLDCEIEIKLWEMKRYWYKKSHYFNKALPAGVIMPILIIVISYGYVYWLASLVFEVKQRVYRAAKRWGLYKFSEVTEYHTGWIAAWGVIANLIFAIIGYLVGYPEFARFSIYFAFFNLIPFSDLDGNKIFFGSMVLWSFLAAVTLIALGYAFLLI